jgi:predicted phosphohydrolase
MLIQYASDLHLEFNENKAFLKINPLPIVGDILILAGDIGLFSNPNTYDNFIKYVSKNFKTTYWIPGNHEYYGYEMALKSGKLFEKIRPNVFLVNDYAVVIEDVTFIFSTFWTKIGDAQAWQIERGVNDFRVIKYKNYRLSTNVVNDLHTSSFNFVADSLKNKQTQKSVVVTHHVPTYMHYPPQYKNSSINEAFATEYHDFILENGPDFWLYGHHHHNAPDFKIGHTTLLTNQLGYVAHGEHLSFDGGKVFEV